MKNSRSVLSLLLVFVLLFSIASCTRVTPSETTTSTAETVVASVTEVYSDTHGDNTQTVTISETQISLSEVLPDEPDGTETTLQKSSTTQTLPESTAGVPETETTVAVISETETAVTISPETDNKTVRVKVNCRNAVSYGITTVPQDGVILDKEVPYYSGDTAMDVLKRALESESIEIDESRGYVRGIAGLSEKDCGSTSGWMYMVNSEVPMTSSDKYAVSPGDVVTFYYVTNYGDTV